jgi:hypothetical protein
MKESGFKNRIVFRIKYLLKQIIVLYFNLFIRAYERIFFKRKIEKSEINYNFISEYSDAPRSLEIKEEDYSLEEVIITCYFTKKADPQSNIVRAVADIKYIEPWYYSILKLKIKGIIIHDGLEDSFIQQYQNEYVQFREFKAGKYSIFEERWMAYYLFISETNLKNVFITDASDVIITKAPFNVITNPLTLYIGRDGANKIGLSSWMTEELDNYITDSKCKIRRTYYYQQVYNAGVVGGSRKLLLFFIGRVIRKTLLTKTSCHKDMNLLNLVIHENFFPKLRIMPYEKIATIVENDNHITHKYLISGYPLNSEFNKYQNDSDAYFIHK